MLTSAPRHANINSSSPTNWIVFDPDCRYVCHSRPASQPWFSLQFFVRLLGFVLSIFGHSPVSIQPIIVEKLKSKNKHSVMEMSQEKKKNWFLMLRVGKQSIKSIKHVQDWSYNKTQTIILIKTLVLPKSKNLSIS